MANFRSRRTIVRQKVGIKFEFMVNDRSRLANDRSRKNSSRRTHREQFCGRTSVRGERSFAVYVKLVGVGDIFGEQFASSRRTPRGFARTRANSRGVRRTFAERSANAGERWRSSRNKKVGERLANAGGVRADSREFARVRASSRRTIVRQI